MLTALRHACRIGGRVRIWSDNDAVVQVTKKALRERVRVDNGSHSDLIGQLIHIGRLLQGRDIRIVKVVSHCSAALTADPVETWAFWHNSLVDELAGKVNFRLLDHVERSSGCNTIPVRPAFRSAERLAESGTFGQTFTQRR